ncbi:hypothetical protein M408DRAFT_127635 [Serendipita vermifera MAFF 305830]|uniref:Uncharacterized protein n=1 Tax=Serendipita vermifera MAFF 305830 TaxID=933852 RepID=A0A0C3BCA7_SERVB|nr:hypothetical protein M408DRAFT_127635 [Serendipita vermifera MAFF 305830]
MPTDLRVWTAYPLRAIISKEVTRDTFASHRTCNPAALPIRTMLYYHLRALYKDISDPTIESPAFKTKQDEKAYLHNLADAMKLFDRILAEEYTQGSREDEPRLEDPGSCDFCGTEIFHAALVCSSKFGLWARSLIPDKCCEVRLCPSCCSEGRSCLCGNLRLCTVFDYEELVDMRNKIWAWCLSREETLDVPDEIAQVLTTS